MLPRATQGDAELIRPHRLTDHPFHATSRVVYHAGREGGSHVLTAGPPDQLDVW